MKRHIVVFNWLTVVCIFGTYQARDAARLHEPLAADKLIIESHSEFSVVQAKNQTTTSKPITTATSSANTNVIRSSLAQHSHQHHQQNNSLASVRSRWRQLEHSVGNSLRDYAQQLEQTLANLEKKFISKRCQLALSSSLEALTEQRLWSTQMLDASARLPSGLLEGTLTELGNYDECLGVSYSLDGSGRQSVNGVGQYCSIQVKPNLPARPRLHTVCRQLPALATNGSGAGLRLLSQQSHQFYYIGLRLGICLPSQCNQSDVQQLVSSVLSKYELNGQVKSCQNRVLLTAERTFDTVQQYIICAFAIVLSLVCVGTLLDLMKSGAVDSMATQARLNGSSLPAVAHNNHHHHHHHQQQQQQQQQQQRRWHLYRVCENSGESVSGTSGVSVDQQVNSAPIAALIVDPKKDLTSVWNENIWNLQPNNHNDAAAARYQLPKQETKSSIGTIISTFLICFSIRTNLRTISKLTPTTNDRNTNKSDNATHQMGDIKVIHGLRTLAMVWIIFGHTIGLVSPEMLNNLFPVAQLSCTSRLLQAMLNATLAVNIFFMISGLVTTISFARRCKSAFALVSCLEHDVTRTSAPLVLDKEAHLDASSTDSSSSLSSSDARQSTSTLMQSIDARGTRKRQTVAPAATQSQQPDGVWPSDFRPLLWLIMRYLRLTPTYAATIGITLLLPALGSGPFWSESVVPMGSACRQNWWLNLVYINNFIETDKLCLIHSWYLSNDWQFFIVATLLLAVYYKSKKLALVLAIGLVLGSSAMTFVVTVSNEFPPTIVTTSPALAERWTFIHSLYYKPWPHLSSYIVGLLTGYLIIIRDRIRISSPMRTTCWITFTLLAGALLNSIYPWNMGLHVDPNLTGLHGATFRTLWSICCAWLVFALVTRPRNPLALFLGWSGFQVSSRLTYCAYLLHPLIIYYHFGTLRERMDSSLYGQAHRFLATLLLSYLSALLLSLFIESPSIRLQQMFCSNSTNRSQSSMEMLPTSIAIDADDHLMIPSRKSTITESSWTTSDETIASSDITPPGSAGILHCEQQQQQQPIASGQKQHAAACCQHVIAPPVPARGPESESSVLSNAVDEEFQRKLAQAIGRGFKLRSKIVNGSVRRSEKPAPQLARRSHKSKQICCPDEAQPISHLLASERFNLVRGGELSTFGATPTARQTQLSSQQQQQDEQNQTRPMFLAYNNNVPTKDLTNF